MISLREFSTKPLRRGHGFLLVLLLWWPASARAAEADSGVAWSVAAGFGVLAAAALAALAYLWTRYTSARGEARTAAGRLAHLGAAIAAGGAGAYYWAENGDEAGSPNLAEFLGISGETPPTFTDLLGALEPDAAASLETAIGRLRITGKGFALRLKDREGNRIFRAAGARSNASAGAADILWLDDIGEQVKRIAALKQESESLRGLIDALPIPIWRRDATQKITDCNPTYARAVEAASRAAAIEDGSEITTGIIAEAGRSLAARASQSGEPQTERHHVVVGGTRRLLELREAPIGGNGGTAGAALDFTEVYEAQSELSRYVSAHDEVLENLATAIIIFGADKRVKFFNSSYTRMWQLDGEWLSTEPELGEVMEMQRERRLLPEAADFPAFKRSQIKLFTSLTEPREELVHQPNGATLRMVITPHPLGGLLFTYEDVTDKLALEASYNTLIDVQRETLDNMSEGVAVFGGDGLLKLSNPVYGRMWQFTPEFLASEPHVGSVLDKSMHLFIHGDDWPAFKQTVIDRITGRDARSGRIERTDGSVLEYGFTPLPDGGVLASYLDVSDSIRVERALRDRAEALETADRLKSEFIANVSYELRTPLNTIIGFTEILDNQYFGELNERQSEYAAGILDSSQRLLALINDILDLATIEAGRMLLDVERVDVRQLLDGVIALAGEAARERELRLNFECPPDIGEIEADERRLKHALYNLVGNAIKFSEPGGTVTLSARREKDSLLLSVADTGMGISDEDRERVFDKFVRGKSPDGRAVGAGLGLPLVKNLVELHGGSLSLESAPNKGTRITCRLPIDSEAAEIDPEIAPPEPRRAEA